jgi:hypothetical protein
MTWGTKWVDVRGMDVCYIAVREIREEMHYFMLYSLNVVVVVKVGTAAGVIGSRCWPIGGRSTALPSWTIVKCSCRSYAAAASFAASIHIRHGHCPDSKGLIVMENLQFCCLSLRRFSQFDTCTFLGLLYFTPKYRSTSFASPMGWQWFEPRMACQ